MRLYRRVGNVVAISVEAKHARCAQRRRAPSIGVDRQKSIPRADIIVSSAVNLCPMMLRFHAECVPSNKADMQKSIPRVDIVVSSAVNVLYTPTLAQKNG